MKTHQERQQEFRDSKVTLESMIYIATSLGVNSRSEWIGDSLNSFFLLQETSVIEEIFGTIPESISHSYGTDRDSKWKKWVVDSGKLGFLAQFMTKVSTLDTKYPFTATRWIYDENMDNLLDKGVEWARHFHKEVEKTTMTHDACCNVQIITSQENLEVTS